MPDPASPAPPGAPGFSAFTSGYTPPVNPREYSFKTPDPPVLLRTDGPTLAEWTTAGYRKENYPPAGYTAKR